MQYNIPFILNALLNSNLGGISISKQSITEFSFTPVFIGGFYSGLPLAPNILYVGYFIFQTGNTFSVVMYGGYPLVLDTGLNSNSNIPVVAIGVIDVNNNNQQLVTPYQFIGFKVLTS